MGGQKKPKNVGHHLCTFPKLKLSNSNGSDLLFIAVLVQKVRSSFETLLYVVKQNIVFFSDIFSNNNRFLSSKLMHWFIFCKIPLITYINYIMIIEQFISYQKHYMLFSMGLMQLFMN